jgi:hypothetical protein
MCKGRGCVTIGGGGEWMMMLGFDTSKRVFCNPRGLEIVQGAIRENTLATTENYIKQNGSMRLGN